jgi:hypothetical protein
MRRQIQARKWLRRRVSLRAMPKPSTITAILGRHGLTRTGLGRGSFGAPPRTEGDRGPRLRDAHRTCKKDVHGLFCKGPPCSHTTTGGPRAGGTPRREARRRDAGSRGRAPGLEAAPRGLPPSQKCLHPSRPSFSAFRCSSSALRRRAPSRARSHTCPVFVIEEQPRGGCRERRVLLLVRDPG